MGIQIDLTVRDRGTATISKTGRAISALEKTTVASAGRMSRAVESMKNNWIGATVGITAATVAMKKGFDLARESAQFEEDFGRLNKQLLGFGTNAKTVIEAMREVSNNQLSLVETTQLASRGLAAGLNPAALEKFTALADVAGDVLGKSLPSAFDALTQAAATGSGAVLTQLGIFIDLELETLKLAEATGRTTTEIGEQERSAIGLKKILEQLDGAVERFGATEVSAADKMTAFTASLTDAKLRLGFFTQAIGLAAFGVVEILGGVVNASVAAINAPFLALLDGLGIIESGTDRALSQSADLIESGIERIKLSFARLELGIDPLSGLQKGANDAGGEIETLTQEQIKAAIAADLLAQAVTFQTASLSTLQSSAAATTVSLQGLQQQQADLAAQEQALLAQRAAIRGTGDVQIRNLFGDGPVDLSGLGLDDQFLAIEARVATLRDEIASTTGATQEAAISDLEELVPAFRRVTEELFNPAFARAQTEELMDAVVAAQQAGIDAQLSQIEEQRTQTELSLSLVRDFASQIADDMGVLFASIQGQAATATEAVKGLFTDMLNTIQQATQSMTQVSAQPPPGPFVNTGGPSGSSPFSGSSPGAVNPFSGGGTGGFGLSGSLPGGGGSISPIFGSSFASGTPFVPQDMVAQIHEGEAIIPAANNPFASGAASPAGGTTINVGGITVMARSEDPVEVAKQVQRELLKLSAFGVA